jgi:hypothetical protein
MLIIILLFLFIDVILAIDGRLDSPDNIHNFHLVVDFSMTMIVLGLIGCVYVFYRVYKQWILNGKKLAMIYRLPFYTACTGRVYQRLSCRTLISLFFIFIFYIFLDFLINCNFFINMVSNLMHILNY